MNSKKPKELTAQEQALFAEAVKNVKPLNYTGQKPLLNKPIGKKSVRKPVSKPAISESPLINLDELAPTDWIGVEDLLSFHVAGLQNKLLKKFAQGCLPIEARLDLHRLTCARALAQAEDFLARCQQQGRRIVLIIHGKGKKSDKPILKNALNIWLRKQIKVLAFHSARPKDGGAGAVYVLLSSL